MATVGGTEQTPLSILRRHARTIIAHLLNSTKVIPSPEGLPRDWRGLAHLCGVAEPGVGTIGEKDPTNTILSAWQKQENATIEQLCRFLEQLDRHDVLADAEDAINEDIQRYAQGGDNVSLIQPSVEPSPCDQLILTVDDMNRIERGLPPQTYDAFLLFADEDHEFAETIVNTLENDYNLKICYRDRDLIGGVSFEHEAIMRLISERCNRLVIIISENFFKSPVNKFFTTFAQAIGIDQQRRKVVPCRYRLPAEFILPPELKYYFMLDYARASSHWNFWDRLNSSISSPAFRTQTSTNRCTIRELPCPLSASEEGKKHVEEENTKKKVSDEAAKLSYLAGSRLSLAESTSQLLTTDKELDTNYGHSSSSSDGKQKRTSVRKAVKKYLTLDGSSKMLSGINNVLKRKKKEPVSA